MPAHAFRGGRLAPATDDDPYLTAQQAALLIPSHRTGRGVHVSMIHRAMRRGTRCPDGQVRRLRGVRTPAGWLTRRSWLDEYLLALTAGHDPTAPVLSGGRTAAQRRRAAEAAGRALDKAGLR